MTTETTKTPPFRGNQPRTTAQLEAWHAGAQPEAALEPALPIIDPHHHLYDSPATGSRYMLPDLLADLACGHRIVATVYVEAYHSMWRARGDEAMRPVGEIEFARGIGAVADSEVYGPCRVAASIVGFADLSLGDGVAPVLEAMIEAGGGRLRGIRQQAAYDPGPIGATIKHRAPAHLLLDPAFQKGFAHLARHGLSFDGWVYHPQLDEWARLAARFPDTVMVLDHVGGVCGVPEYPGHRQAFDEWRAGLKAVAACPNVRVKVGGMGMAVFGFGFEHGERPAASQVLARAWQPYIDTCLELFGPERCMFESNFPVDRQSCGYAELWNAFKIATASLSAGERRALFHDTAARTYHVTIAEASA